MTKEEKIKETTEKWRVNKGRGTVVWPTRMGKSLLAIDIVRRFLNRNPDKTVVIGVPTQALQYQWYNLTLDKGVYGKCRVYTYDYIIKNIYECDLLIVDEIHKAVSDNNINIFKIRFKYILGLTATLERSDNKHIRISKICPTVEEVSKEEAIKNGWINNYKEYKVIIDVPDIDIYQDHDAKFQKYFNFFNQDFELAMSSVKSKDVRRTITDFKKCNPKITDACTFGFNRELKARIEFIQSHPKKIQLAKKILEKRKTSKTIIFSPTIEISRKFQGFYYNSNMSNKEKIRELSDFQNCVSGVLSAVNGITLGMELNGCNLALMLCNNSSFDVKEQKIGRLLSKRKDGIIPEAFTFVLKNTAEEAWFSRSTKENDYITITEKMLDRLLDGEEILEERIEGPTLLYHY